MQIVQAIRLVEQELQRTEYNAKRRANRARSSGKSYVANNIEQRAREARVAWNELRGRIVI